MAIKKIITRYEDSDKTIDDLIQEFAPNIIAFNMNHGWEDDNFYDILLAIQNKYLITGDDYDLLEYKLGNKLNK